MGFSFGDISYKKQPGAKYSVARNGIASYDVVYKGEGFFSILQGAYSTDYPNCLLMSWTVTESGDSCEMMEVALHFEGYDDSQTSSTVREDSTLEITASQEPIETHPDFIKFAGIALHTVNKARFKTDGSFDFFEHNIGTADNPELNQFAGVQSYLYPRQIFTVDKVETAWPTQSKMDDLGKIVNLSDYTENQPPNQPASVPAQKAWLSTGARVRNIGNAWFETQYTLSMSGPRGWIRQIYSTSPEPWEG